MSDSDFKKVASLLAKQGITIEKHTVSLHHAQGFINNVYKAESSIGPIIIHIGAADGEQKRQKVWEKLFIVGKLLDGYPEIPTASVLLAEKFDRKRYAIVQKFLKGETLGRWDINDNVFTEKMNHWSPALEKNIIQNIVRVHEIKITGCGWIQKGKNGEPKGMYPNWSACLKDEFALWMKTARKTEKDPTFIEKFERYFETYYPILAIDACSLVHGDLNNPGNIMIEGDKVTGFVDWELCLSGDPAWEFCFENRYSIPLYFDSLKTKLSESEKIAFTQRAKLYTPLFLLRSLHIHSQVGRKEICGLARATLKRLGF